MSFGLTRKTDNMPILGAEGAVLLQAGGAYLTASYIWATLKTKVSRAIFRMNIGIGPQPNDIRGMAFIMVW